MNNKTILFFAKYFYPPLGGGEYFLLKILKHLKEQGYNVAAACYCDPSNEKYFDQNGYLEWQGIPVFQLAIRHRNDFNKFLEKSRPDLVVTQSFDAPEIVEAAKSVVSKTITGVHFWRNICAVQDNFVNMLNRPLESVELLEDKHRVFFESDEVFVNSEFMKDALKRFTGFECNNTIHPIIDLDRITVKERNPKYVTLINPDYGKGGELLVELAYRLQGVEFMCVGLGNTFFPRNKVINEKIASLKNIKLVKKTDDMLDVYSQTKILLVPSLVDETFSMVVLEGMFNGIPILASNVGNIPYLLEDGGFLLPPNDVIAWESAIDGFFNDEDLYNDMSKRGKEVAKRYLPENELEKFMKLVKGLIG